MDKKKNRVLIWKLIGTAIVAWTLAGIPAPLLAGEMAAGMVDEAIAVLHPTANSNVSGFVSFTRKGDGVKISASVEGLKPGKHGFHIHEYGDCSAPDGTSAGGHYNPEGYPHAGPDSAKRHMGDLGNLVADKTGRAHYERMDTHVKLSGPHTIVGHAVIVHAGEDDLTSQPTGAAGGRQACGVIGVAKP